MKKLFAVLVFWWVTSSLMAFNPLGSTEITQILNNIQLFQQTGQMFQQALKQLEAFKNMVNEVTAITDQAEKFIQDVEGMAKEVKDTVSLVEKTAKDFIETNKNFAHSFNQSLNAQGNVFETMRAVNKNVNDYYSGSSKANRQWEEAFNVNRRMAVKYVTTVKSLLDMGKKSSSLLGVTQTALALQAEGIQANISSAEEIIFLLKKSNESKSIEHQQMVEEQEFSNTVMRHYMRDVELNEKLDKLRQKHSWYYEKNIP